MRAALLVAAGAVLSWAGSAPFELAVRTEPGGFTTLRCESPKVSVDAWQVSGRDYSFRGSIDGAPTAWSARRIVEFSADERIEGYRLSGDGLEARLEPLHADRGDFRLVLEPGGRTAVRFDPEGGGSGTEYILSGGGVTARTRSVGARSRITGTADPAAADPGRLCAVGAALALIRLDPPLRRRMRAH